MISNREILLMALRENVNNGQKLEIDGEIYTLLDVDENDNISTVEGLSNVNPEDVKLYLYSLDILKDELEEKYNGLCTVMHDKYEVDGNEYEDTFLSDNDESFAFLAANHIDFRGIIQRGYGIEVNDSNNPY